jgi:hypothetical protein
MLIRRVCCWFGLLLLFASFAHASTACSTHWGRVKIGAVGQNPFTGDVLVTSWQSKRRVGLLIVFQVARDNDGRVSIKGPMSYSEPGESYLDRGPKKTVGDPDNWQMTICDPLAGTTTNFTEGPNLGSKQAYVFLGLGLIPGLLQSGDSGCERNRNGNGGEWVDLGYAERAGMRTRGCRWQQEKAPQENFTERWFSEDLVSELATVTVDQIHNTEVRAELTHIRRLEPDPSLFQIPPGYAVVQRGAAP